MINHLFKSLSKPKAMPFLAFLIPLFVRAIPELLMGSFVTGFDTIAYYIPNTLFWMNNGIVFSDFIAIAPLFYILLIGVTTAGVPIILSLKIISPFLLGSLGIVIFFYAKKTLLWSEKKSLLASLFATLYFVALRISWDMLRSELGLIFLFIALIFIEKKDISLKNGLLLSLTMFLVISSHQLVAQILFIIILVTIVRLGIDKKLVDICKLVVCSVPAVFLFFIMVYLNYFQSLNYSVIQSFPTQTSGGWSSLFGFVSSSHMISNTLGFLVFCFLPLLPLLVLKFKRSQSNFQLNIWIFWILITILSVVIYPSVFIAVLPYRWILLLTFPLTIFAADGFTKLRLNWHKLSIALLVGILSLGFMILPHTIAFPYFGLFSSYVPSSMLQNTVPLDDCQDTMNALHWVENNLYSDEHLLVHTAFYGWSLLMINESQIICYGYENFSIVAQELVENGLQSRLFLICWVNGNGWHNLSTVPSVFSEVYKSGDIAIFIYDANISTNVSDLNLQ